MDPRKTFDCVFMQSCSCWVVLDRDICVLEPINKLTAFLAPIISSVSSFLISGGLLNGARGLSFSSMIFS